MKKVFDMEKRELNIGDEILVATRDSHIRRAKILEIQDGWLVKVQMIKSKRITKVMAEKTFKLSDNIELRRGR